MKLIKKIAAIMFAFMMVFSLSTNAKAEEGITVTGKITVNNAVNEENYKLYKILDLVSYVPGTASSDPDDKGIYSYKPNNDWTAFLNDGSATGGKQYILINNDGYADWKGEKTEARRAEFAKKALAWANDNHVDPVKTVNASGNKAEFTGLALGYYLVDSGVGSLCGLTTTNPNAEINEKNGEPTVDKGVWSNVDEDYKNHNYAKIGDVITFQTIIHVKKGAKNYVLHDEMGKGLKLKDIFDNQPLHVTAHGTIFEQGPIGVHPGTDYSFAQTENGFTVTFTPEFLKSYEDKEYDIYVNYAAILTKDAEISYSTGLKPNRNDTYLTYGDKPTKSTKQGTATYTFGIPVYKFTKKFGDIKALPDAQFKLHANDNNVIELIKVENTTVPTYRRFMTGDDVNKKVDTIITDKNGTFHITGLDLGTYYLEETKAPDGYNKLKDKIIVELTTVGNEPTKPVLLKQNDIVVDEIGVENNAGSLLPSTGGMGTTLIYLIGGALVLGSGFVLANKKRAKSK
ncbi:SpaH/EbpB family LPXTG-anchored major pilin [Holdemanella porci]|uniref:SpaH/EbpB family LPXTG-anchored major pilin n=1 Tax=Holdemanella porci TaxID=2652276 RepID=UPI003F8C2403